MAAKVTVSDASNEPNSSLSTPLWPLLYTLTVAILAALYINKRPPITPSSSSKEKRKPLTIRIVNIPKETREEFLQYVKETFGSFSLAPSVSSVDDKWVATISLIDNDGSNLPEAFRACIGLVGTVAEKQVDVQILDSMLSLSVDSHFHGLTPLNYTENTLPFLYFIQSIVAVRYMLYILTRNLPVSSQ
jgi:hypothetical protein